MGLTDAGYLRFKIQESKFSSLAVGASKQSETTPCIVFDRIKDNFYIGGANFDPYEKLILYATDDVPAGQGLSLSSFLPISSCPGPRSLRSVRHLTGRHYLGVTNPDNG